jgi:hypothetical protein
MTTLVVVATGNHYFLDAVAGTLLACLVWAVVSRARRTRGEQRPHFGEQDRDAEAEREVVVVGSGAFGHGPGQDRRAGP